MLLIHLVWILERTQGPLGYRFCEGKGVASLEIDVFVDQWREARDIC